MARSRLRRGCGAVAARPLWRCGYGPWRIKGEAVSEPAGERTAEGLAAGAVAGRNRGGSLADEGRVSEANEGFGGAVR